MGNSYILSIDQGTTSTRAIVFGEDFSIRAVSQREFPQHFPQSGWVEHDPEDLWNSVIETVKEALEKAQTSANDIAAIGITNQRETTVIWERDSGRPIHNAIVWQDRRAAALCDAWRDAGAEAMVTEKTGLLLDPYFSASKIAWILQQDPALARRAAAGELLFGTIDSFLLWRLSNGKIHKTDATNASRTMLLNIHTGDWDDDLLQLFGVPRAMLPVVDDCAADFAVTDMFGGRLGIRGIAGDQQAAMIGQACFQPGMLKATYGTGCFALQNIGDVAVRSTNRLLTTVAYQLNGKRTYALEGSIFIAGASVQWLRDGLQIITDAAESGDLAANADDTQEIILVPAFTGLGAPYWNADVRGAMFGLTRTTGKNEFARAALESVCFQTRDLLSAMQSDRPAAADEMSVLRVDGGMAASDWTMQRLADILGAPVERPVVLETTAWGAAYLAGFQAGVYPPPAAMVSDWKMQQRFQPTMESTTREKKYTAWRTAVRKLLA